MVLYRSSSTWSRIDEAPHGRLLLRIATTTQLLPLASRLKPARARTVFRVPVLTWASPAIGVRRRRLRMVPSIATIGSEETYSAE
ncbi:hypothetical protein D3C76_1109110 [compost metagenome]